MNDEQKFQAIQRSCTHTILFGLLCLIMLFAANLAGFITHPNDILYVIGVAASALSTFISYLAQSAYTALAEVVGNELKWLAAALGASSGICFILGFF